ncbi:MAG: AI-2E family transporter [Bacteroidetes bacterium]|nr:AI-2E family transporter [Bacteroidota bacterium]MDA0873885.1 AI-2E family transporter [Bacteroidota bacterium]
MPTVEDRSQPRSQRRFLLFLVIIMSILFLWMVRAFLITMLLGAIFTAMAMPLHRVVRRWVGGDPRSSLAAAFSLLILIVAVGLPIFLFLGVVATQALEISEAARPWLENQINEVGRWEDLVSRFPFLSYFFPEEGGLLAKLSQYASEVGRFLADSVVDFTRGTAAFTLQIFVLLYSMFFFLKDGPTILDRILYYIPLPETFEQELVNKIVSVSGVVLKGSMVIGMIQGGLAGLAFLVAGIPGWAFWTTVMVVLSLIPAIGSALVWIPAAIYLFSTGSTAVALTFTLWCAVVVGTVDNFLRPWIVGQGTRMPDLLVLISTLGGIFLFGAVGFILGPVIASLFLGTLYIYGEMFSESLGEKPKSMREEEIEEAFARLPKTPGARSRTFSLIGRRRKERENRQEDGET